MERILQGKKKLGFVSSCRTKREAQRLFENRNASLHIDASTSTFESLEAFRSMVQTFETVVDGKDYAFPTEEKKILAFWEQIDAFQEQLRRTSGKEEFVFFDGPPFATGLPHYGHILAGTIKDIITRHASATGRHVERRFGWDCHGLPVEHEIDKAFSIKSKEDVLKMGIDKYNEECRNIVMRYSQEWRKTITRVGRWIDFDNDYKTMDLSFMESVWWVFKQLHNKGLVYQGFKVMPYSTACNTPLSNFEAGLDYRDVSDPAVLVKFRLAEQSETFFIAWTTTPWTLPANLSLCVNPDIEYCFLENPEGQTFIIADVRKSFLPGVMKKGKGDILAPGWKVSKIVKGAELEGIKYTPVYSCYEEKYCGTAFKVTCDVYVTSDSGTGVVHQAPAYGEDDYRVCITKQILPKDGQIPDPVNANGCFTCDAPDFVEGLYIKDSDARIIQDLKDRKLLLHSSRIVHSYPFCWRSKTPLIYRAVSSYFVHVESIKSQLLSNNKETSWVPSYVKEKRFHNWIEGARDWAISRNRYWGTPIPIWQSPDGEETLVVGSVQELETLTNTNNILDIHRHKIDHLTIPSRRGPDYPPLRRVEDVFDCWFESGSMPYAQQHYPFENGKEFEENFPADFVAEGLDQTRGWFYTLMVLSTALFDRPAFKNLICNGLVLAADGKKMSKSLKNYPDPNEVIDKYGADALRLYLINSPVVRAEPLRFKEEGVFAVLKDVFLPWYNAYRFLIQNVSRIEAQTNTPFIPIDDTNELSNPLDRWILGASGSLIDFITDEMRGYRLYTVVPRLIEFIEQLTNIYVRYNRARLKGDNRDSFLAMNTLFIVLLSLCKAMAPFTPFFVESMYQNLKKCLSDAEQSIHFCEFPNATDDKYDVELQTSVSRMQNVIEMGRVIRERRNKPLKFPLARAIIAHTDNTFLQKISSDLRSYVVSELNVRDIEVSNDVMAYVTQKAAPNFATLGKRLGKSMKTVKNAIENMTKAEISSYKKCGMVELAGFTLDKDDILLKYDFSEKLSESRDAICDADGLILILDLETDQSLLDEGLAREVVNRVQKMRKSSGLQLRDAVLISYSISKHNESDATLMLKRIFEGSEKHFKEAFGTVPKDESSVEVQGVVIAEEDVILSTGASVSFKLFRPVTASTESDRPEGIDAYLKNRDLALLEAQLPSLKVELDGEVISPSIRML
jgi:isoleucyl-tRNA synthetase